MTTTLKSFKLPLAIAAIGMLTFAANAQNYLTNGLLPAPVAVGAISNISYLGGGNGNNIAVDSYNSHDTNHSVNGQYPAGNPSMVESNGNVVSGYGFVNFVNIQIDGSLYLGPNATNNGSGIGIVTGDIYTNSNVQFPDVTQPVGANYWPMATTTNTTVRTYKNNGVIQTTVRSTYDFHTSGNYIVNQDLPIIVEAGVTVNINYTGTTYSGTGINLNGSGTNTGTAVIFFNGPSSVTLGGNIASNPTGTPENLWYYGLPSLTSITYGGNSAFVGVIYAPEVNMTLNGGGSSPDISGSVVVNSISDKGHYNFHFDESLPPGQVWINSQPSSQAVPLGSNASFTVSVFGTAPFWYLWCQRSLDSSNLRFRASGTNYSTLTLTNVQASDAGFYFVAVSSAYGTMTSSIVVLTVNLPVSPTITAQPTNLTVMIGSPAAFSVTADGTAPLNYQWQLNLTNILDATNAIYTIPAAAVTDGGVYSVVVTNVAGSVTSSNALLTVNVPPAVSLQFLDGSPVLNLSGMLNSNFVVQYNTDLTTTNWVDLTSISNLTSSPYQYIDPDGMDQQARFYRVIMR